MQAWKVQLRNRQCGMKPKDFIYAFKATRKAGSRRVRQMSRREIEEEMG